MPPLQTAQQVVGLAKQTAKGSPATNPTFAHSIESGKVGGMDITQERAPLTSATTTTPYVERNAISGGMGSFPMRAHPRTIGLYLLGILGAVNTTGAGPYTHTITSQAGIPYFTLFDKRYGSAYQSIQDCRISSLEISWDGAGTVKVDVELIGGIPDFSVTFTPATDESTAPYFRAGGGTFELSVDTSTPVTARVKSGSIKMSRNLEPVVLSASLIPDEHFPKAFEIDWELVTVPENLDDWRTVLTGTAAGTAVSEGPVIGSAEVGFVLGSDTLTFTSTAVAFNTDIPDASADGGPAELTLAGIALEPTPGTTPITAVLVNSQATY